MLGCQMLGDSSRRRRFVIFALFEADRERFDRAAGHGSHERDDESGIDAPRSENAPSGTSLRRRSLTAVRRRSSSSSTTSSGSGALGPARTLLVGVQEDPNSARCAAPRIPPTTEK